MEPLTVIDDNHVISPISSVDSNSPNVMRITNNSNYSNIDYDAIHQHNGYYQDHNHYNMNHMNHNNQEYKPKLLTKIKTKSLTILNESKQGKLPSPVLTKQNSKIWTDSNFDEYEKELMEQMEHLQTSQQISTNLHYGKQSLFDELPSLNITSSKSEKKKRKKHHSNSHKKKKKHHRRNSSLTFRNSHDWSNREMSDYEQEMLSQFNHLANQFKQVQESTISQISPSTQYSPYNNNPSPMTPNNYNYNNISYYPQTY
mmetsp:Transcript_58903/g.53063  ORF Transcript_58903/g.53063 Transcript_58903/m.53063 type:complete len:257 (+) Transcript_58903:107-877(+)